MTPRILATVVLLVLATVGVHAQRFARSFASIEEMVAANVAIHSNAVVAGIRGGTFYVTNIVTGTNVLTRYKSVISGQSWQRIYDGAANVLWSGATTNGVDSRAAIQGALDSGVPLLRFPGGITNTAIYTISGPLVPVSGQTLEGDGDRSTIIQTGALSSSIAGTNLADVTIRGLRFVGLADDSLNQAASVCNGIYVLTSTNLLVTSCTFSNHSGQGVYFDAVKDSRIVGNRFDLAGWGAVNKNTTTANYQTGDIRLAGNTEGVIVSENDLHSYANFGVSIVTEPVIGGNPRHNFITGNTIKGYLKYGIMLYSNAGGAVSDNTISENQISDVTGQTPGNDGTFSQCAGIYIQTVENTLIVGNTLRNINLYTTNTSVPPGGISVNGSGSVSILDNNLTNCWYYGIVLQTAGNTNGVALVSGNKIYDSGLYRVTGSINNLSTSLTVSSTNGFLIGSTVLVRGAGVAGANLTALVTAIGATTLTLDTAASTTVSGGVVEKPVVMNPCEGGIVVLNRNRADILGNTVFNVYQSGIYLNSGASFVRANGNTVLRPQAYGIQANGNTRSSQFNGNHIEITNAAGLGVTVLDSTAVQIQNNTIFGAVAAVDFSTGHPLVANNLFASCTAGIAANSANTNVGPNTFIAVTTPLGGSAIQSSTIIPFNIYNNALVASNLTIGTTATVRAGTGTPEGVVTAVVGSLFLRTDGGASTTLYIKQSGAGNTGWVAAGSGGVSPPVTLTDAATITTDASLGNHFRVTLGGNRTLANPTNPTDGQEAKWEIIQDGAGNRTLALDTQFAFGTDVGPSFTPSTAPNKRDFFTATYNSTTVKWTILGITRGY